MKKKYSILSGIILPCILFTKATSSSYERLPFTLGIRDSFMIAHSFHKDPHFGPAGGLHGATFTCDVEFSTTSLQPKLNWVMDIGEASSILSQVLSKYNLKNLDELFLEGEYTTSEFMAQQVFTDLVQLLKEKQIPFHGEINVKLWESHKAWACYRGSII